MDLAARSIRIIASLTLTLCMLAFGATGALADGDDTLGPSVLPDGTPFVTETGTGIVVAGVGLFEGQPGDIEIFVPGTPKQVILYYHGVSNTDPGGGCDGVGDDTVRVDGVLIPNTILAGTTLNTASNPDACLTTFKATIFSSESAAVTLDPGLNVIPVEGLNFDVGNDGAALFVIYDDGVSDLAEIDLRDGNDFAFLGASGSLEVTVPQTFAFAPTGFDRTADLRLIAANVTNDLDRVRGNFVRTTVSGPFGSIVTDTMNPFFGSDDGLDFDTEQIEVELPAGADSLTVQAFSAPEDAASLTWITAGLAVPPSPPIVIEKFTNGYDADDADGFPVLTPPDGGFEVGGTQVPLVAIGDPITWTYVVTNTGPETLVNVTVTDSEGVMVVCPQDTLAPSESITCLAMGTGLDLDTDPNAVDGCGAQGMGMTRPTYENVGSVVGTGETSRVEVTDEDPSHYCNPPDVMIEKFTNGHDGDDPNGIPAAGPGSGEPGDLTVAEVPSGEEILWTYVVTNNGDEDLENVVVTDSRNVMVSCPQDTLAPGETITCTATGSADDLAMTGGDVDGCGAGTGDTRPTYENVGSVEARGTTSGVVVEDDDPSHYCNPRPPECGLMIQKGCELPPPPAPPEGKCEGRLQQFTMVWPGGPITVSGPDNDAPGGLVGPGDVVTFFGPFDDNDVVVSLSGAQNGESTFHTSCSDKDMDGDTTTNEDQQQVSSFGRDCGKFQGNGKGSSGINDWLLEGFVDKGGAVLDCSTDEGELEQICEFNAIPADCDNPDKPENLTWQYTGGGCAASDNDQGSSGDLFCDESGGGVNGNQAVTITDDKDNVFNVAPGGVFTTARDASKVFELVNAGGTEENGRHVSCSQPLQAGDVYGSLTLVGLDGLGLGTNVIYSYLVSNDGPDEVTDIIVTDDQLGGIGSIMSLQPGDSETLTAEAFISETTMNVAQADGDGAPGAICLAESNPVVVKVLPPPPCDVGIAFDKLEDDKIKWKLTNNSVFGKATLQTFTLDFPSDFDVIKKVKLDGDIYKADDSDLVVGPGVTIGEDDWTKDDVTKRQLEQGETRNLEVEFEEKDKNATTSDFDLILTFEEGCVATF